MLGKKLGCDLFTVCVCVRVCMCRRVYAGAYTYLEVLGGQWTSSIARHIIPLRQGLSLNLDLVIFQLASLSDTCLPSHSSLLVITSAHDHTWLSAWVLGI